MGAKLSIAAGAPVRRISAGRRCRYHSAHHWTVVVAAARSTGRHRKSAGGQQYPCRPSGGQLAGRWLHAAVARGSALMATLITSVPFDLQRDLAPVSGLTD